MQVTLPSVPLTMAAASVGGVTSGVAKGRASGATCLFLKVVVSWAARQSR